MVEERKGLDRWTSQWLRQTPASAPTIRLIYHPTHPPSAHTQAVLAVIQMETDQTVGSLVLGSATSLAIEMENLKQSRLHRKQGRSLSGEGVRDGYSLRESVLRHLDLRMTLHEDGWTAPWSVWTDVLTNVRKARQLLDFISGMGCASRVQWEGDA